MKQNENHITLTLEGLPEDGGHVRLSDFIRELQLLQGALTKTDRAVSPENRASTNFRVVDLSHSSPARVVLAAFPKRNMPDVRRLVIGNIIAALVQIQNSEVPDHLSAEILEDLHGMALPVGERLARVALAAGEREVSFTPEFRNVVADMLAPQQVSQGFIRGKLEAINLHGAANVFKIYPRVGPSKVTCHFPSNLLQSAIEAINSYVEVRGTLQYRSRDQYPYAVQVEQIAALLSDESAPSLDDLFGVAPNIAGGIPAEEWVAQRRLESEEEMLALLGEVV